MAFLPAEIFANDTATGTLTADPGSGGTTLTGMAAFPTITSGVNQTRVRVDNEIMLVTAHAAANASATVVRGIEGTTAAAHSIGATVNAVITAEAQRRWTPNYTPHPRHANLLAWNMRPGEISGNLTVVSGTVYYGRMFIPEDMTVTGLAFGQQAVGTTVTNSYVALFNSTGSTRLAVSADQSTALGTAGAGPKRLPFTSTVNLTGGPDAFVLVAYLSNFASGTPTVRGNSAGGHSLSYYTAASDIYYFFTKETAQTAMPTTTDPTTGTTVPGGLMAFGLY